MEISETCIEDGAEFSINNPDKRICARAYSHFLREHYGHEGHAARMKTKKRFFRKLKHSSIIKRTEKKPKGPRP